MGEDLPKKRIRSLAGHGFRYAERWRGDKKREQIQYAKQQIAAVQ